MSLSPLVSFKSRFVTYLLNFPRIIIIIIIIISVVVVVVVAVAADAAAAAAAAVLALVTQATTHTFLYVTSVCTLSNCLKVSEETDAANCTYVPFSTQSYARTRKTSSTPT